MSTKLIGSINLARLKNAGIVNIKGKGGAAKKCVVIPIEDNDIYVKVEEKTREDGEAYTARRYSLPIEIYEKRDADRYGNTHYAKAGTSKDWIERHTQMELEERNGMFLGDFKPKDIPGTNQASPIFAPYVEAGDDSDLPF